MERKRANAVNAFAEVSPASYYQLHQVLDFISPDGAVEPELQTTKRQNERADLRNGIACAVVATTVSKASLSLSYSTRMTSVLKLRLIEI